MRKKKAQGHKCSGARFWSRLAGRVLYAHPFDEDLFDRAEQACCMKTFVNGEVERAIRGDFAAGLTL